MDTCIYEYMHKCTCVYIHMKIYTKSASGARGKLWVPALAPSLYIHKYTCTYINIYTYIYGYIHT